MNAKKSAEARDIEVRFARGHITDIPGFDRLVDTTKHIHYGRNSEGKFIRHDLDTGHWLILNASKTEFVFTPTPQQFAPLEFRKADLLREAGWMDTFIDWVLKPGIGTAG